MAQKKEVKKEIKKLYRTSKNKKVAGVCGGFAEYLDQDPTLVRLIFILIMLITAIIPGLLFYLIAWMVMEEK